MFQDPYEFLPDIESTEGGIIEFKQVGGNSLGFLVVVSVADTFCAQLGWRSDNYLNVLIGF